MRIREAVLQAAKTALKVPKANKGKQRLHVQLGASPNVTTANDDYATRINLSVYEEDSFSSLEAFSISAEAAKSIFTAFPKGLPVEVTNRGPRAVGLACASMRQSAVGETIPGPAPQSSLSADAPLPRRDDVLEALKMVAHAIDKKDEDDKATDNIYIRGNVVTATDFRRVAIKTLKFAVAGAEEGRTIPASVLASLSASKKLGAGVGFSGTMGIIQTGDESRYFRSVPTDWVDIAPFTPDNLRTRLTLDRNALRAHLAMATKISPVGHVRIAFSWNECTIAALDNLSRPSGHQSFACEYGTDENFVTCLFGSHAMDALDTHKNEPQVDVLFSGPLEPFSFEFKAWGYRETLSPLIPVEKHVEKNR